MDTINSGGNETQPSERKVNANRANAAKSTGPKSREGKARSSRNAICHGFFSKAVVLPDESFASYEAMAEQIRSELRPRNVLEELLVTEIINLKWRMDRLLKVESTVFTRKGISVSGHDCGTGFAFVNDAQGLDAFSKLARYEGPLSRRFSKCIRDLCKLREGGWGKGDDRYYSERTDVANDQAYANRDGDKTTQIPGATTTAEQVGSSPHMDNSDAECSKCDSLGRPPEALKDDPVARSSSDQVASVQGTDGATAEPGSSQSPDDTLFYPSQS